MQTPSQPAPDRPRIVTVAFVLYLVAVAGTFGQLFGMGTYLTWEHTLTGRMLDVMGTPGYARPAAGSMDTQLVSQLVVSLLLTAGFWTMIALFVRRGANWARILATVFAAIGVVFGPLAILLSWLLAPPPVAYLVLSIPGFVGLVVATALLWTRPARWWFAAVQAAQRRTRPNQWRGTPAGPAV